MADPVIALKRRMERKARVSDRNKAMKLGWHNFDVREDWLSTECGRHLDDPVIPALSTYTEPVSLPQDKQTGVHPSQSERH